MKILSALLLSFVMNLDSLSISTYYNKKHISIPKPAVVIIGILSTVAIFISMILGKFICVVFHDDICNIFGGLILIFIGIYYFVEFVRIRRNKEGYDTSYYVQPASKYKKLLENPLLINSDSLNIIDIKKSIPLAIALSLNNMDIGFASSITKVNMPLLLLFNFIITIFFILAGSISHKLSNFKLVSDYEKIITGILLIIGGILEIAII